DQMNLNAMVNAGTANVVLSTVTSAQAITVGTKPGGTLGLTQAELDRVTGKSLSIESVATAGTGPITVTAAITSVGTGWTSLGLGTASSIMDTTAANVTAITATGSLGLLAGAGIGGSTAAGLKTAVPDLAFQNLSSGAVTVTNTGPLTIASPAFFFASSFNTGTTTTLSATGGVTFAQNLTSAGLLTVDGGTGVAGDNIVINPGVTVQSTGGNVAMSAGGFFPPPPGSSLLASGSVLGATRA